MIATLQLIPNLIPNADYVRILPEIVLSVVGMIIMLLDPIMDERRSQRLLGVVALLGAIAALAATFFQAKQQFWGFGFWEMVKVDAFSIFFHVLVISVTIIVILSSYEYMEVQQIRAGEYYGLVLFGAVGMALMSSAVELVLIFIALEISSIATYILAGFRRRAAISSEASVKYFLLGSFATQVRLALRESVPPLFRSTEAAGRCWRIWAWRSCSWGLGSRLQRRLFTSGHPMFMKARRRQWWGSCPRRRRRRFLPYCCGSCSRPMRRGGCG